MKYHKHIIVNERSFLNRRRDKTSKSVVSYYNRFTLYKLCWNPQQNHYCPQKILYNGKLYYQSYSYYKPCLLTEDLKIKHTHKYNTNYNSYANIKFDGSVQFESLNEAQKYILVMEID